MFRRLAHALIRVSTTAAEQGAVSGDLEETRVELERSHGRHRADWWFVRQAVIVAAYAARDRALSAWLIVMSLRVEARDLRYAMRLLVRNPGFTVVAMSSLAVGI